ncbi:uncharacterized protein [Palaemon carinicauda]|uniref:uncharacterized protein n=1 Tax=Palaemon carinicauda TaxID=392227 RepID=UPI0035B639A9
MLKLNSRADNLTQGSASEDLPNSLYPLSGELQHHYTITDSLLSNSQLWCDSFLTQTPLEDPMLNSENGSPLSSRKGARNVDGSEDGFPPYQEEVLIQDSEFEDLHMTSLPSANVFGTAERGPPITNYGIPVIIASMRGGHRCLATDSSQCAFTKYKFLLENDDKSGGWMTSSVCISTPMQSLPLTPQMHNRGEVKLEARPTYISPREPEANFSYEGLAGDLKPYEFTKGKTPETGKSKIECSVCHSTFSNLYNWTIHIRWKRCKKSCGKDNNIVCCRCGKRFTTRKGLYGHIKLKQCPRKTKKSIINKQKL